MYIIVPGMPATNSRHVQAGLNGFSKIRLVRFPMYPSVNVIADNVSKTKYAMLFSVFINGADV